LIDCSLQECIKRVDPQYCLTYLTVWVLNKERTYWFGFIFCVSYIRKYCLPCKCHTSTSNVWRFSWMDKLPAGYPLLSFLHNSISNLLPCRLPEAISLQIMIFELLWQPFETHLIIFLWELMIACETIIGGWSLLQSAILTP